MGTPPYISPEQAVGEAEPRSDLYSVGVILYELLTGFRPFLGNAVKIVGQTLHAPPPPFAVRNPSACVPEAIERVVMRCLTKSPDDRPATALALAEEFREAMQLSSKANSLPIPLLVSQAMSEGKPTGRRSLRFAGLAGVTAVGLAVAALAFSRPGNRVTDPEKQGIPA